MSAQDGLFHKGVLLRYSHGPTALFLVQEIFPNHAGSKARYYGLHCMGGTHGAYHETCRRASREDRKTWRENSSWRQK